MKGKGLTFGGFPIEFEVIEGDVLVTCKGVTGTLSEMEAFINRKGTEPCRFGEAKIKAWVNKQVRIDCLIEEMSHIKFLIKHAKELQNGN